jgi:hypothetical protein
LKIDTLIKVKQKDDMISLLQVFADVFSWSYIDMLDLNTDIIIHRIPLIEGNKPVKQKLRRIRSDMLLKVKVEIQSYEIHDF